jgi:hypothetical protein
MIMSIFLLRRFIPRPFCGERMVLMKAMYPSIPVGVAFSSSAKVRESSAATTEGVITPRPKRKGKTVLYRAVSKTLSTGQDITGVKKIISQNFSYENILLLKIYKAVYGDLLIKQRFTVPPYYPWPDWSFGYALGKQAASIRSMQKKGTLSSEVYDALVKLEFVWEYRTVHTTKIQEALQLYVKRVSEDISTMSYRFVVPRYTRKWPKSLWGMKLGQYIQYIRRYPDSNLAKSLSPLLLKYNFDYSKQRGNFEVLKETMLIYKQLHGNLHIPLDYVVPGGPNDTSSTPSPYPKRMHGKCLGEILHAIRSRGDYKQYKAELLAMGFSYSWTYDQMKLITQAFQWYQEQYSKSNKLSEDINFMKTTFTIPYPPHVLAEQEQEQALLSSNNQNSEEVKLPSPGRKQSRLRMPESQMQLLVGMSEPVAMKKKKKKKKTTEEEEENEEMTAKNIQAWKEEQKETPGVEEKEDVMSVTAPADSRLWGMQLGKTLWDIRRRRSYRVYEQHWKALGITFVETIRNRYGTVEIADDGTVIKKRKRRRKKASTK